MVDAPPPAPPAQIAPAPAEAPTAPPTAAFDARAAAFRYDRRIDVPLTVGLLTAWITSEGFRQQLAPASCRFCATNGLDDSVRDALRWGDTRLAAQLSDITAYVVVPGLVVTADYLATREHGGPDLLGADLGIIIEAVAVSQVLNQITKFSVGRERPLARALVGPAKQTTDSPSDNNTSFYSGHASWTFSWAVAAGTVASRRGYPQAPWVFASSLSLAALTGYLRIAADKHYLTDVVTGAAMGAAVGWLVPFLHRGRRPEAYAGVLVVPQLGGELWGLSVRIER
jgi:membrane-associated phospholipid phosphatase